MQKIYTHTLTPKDFTHTLRKFFFHKDTILEIAFQVSWEKIAPEPQAGFPLSRYEPNEVEILELTEICPDGSSVTIRGNILNDKIYHELIDILDADFPQSVLDSAADDWYAANERCDPREDF